MVEITEAEQNKEKRMNRNEDILTDLWDNIKCTNIREKQSEKIFEETILKNFPNMGKENVT